MANNNSKFGRRLWEATAFAATRDLLPRLNSGELSVEGLPY